MPNPNNNHTKARISKRLTRHDVERSLLFPVPRILNFEEGEAFYLYVRDRDGVAYTFPCSTQWNEDMGLVISIHWLQQGFVNAKGIQQNDEVTLLGEFVGGEERWMQFTIELRRKIRLLGKDIWAIVL